MKARPTYACPMLGTTPATGASSAPPAPARAAPKAKVSMFMRLALMPTADAIRGSCVAALAIVP